MCLILFSYCTHPDYKLILASNRDEFYNRPTEQLTRWGQSENIIAGRDIRGGGTWLGVHSEGMFAAITNYRDPATIKTTAPSRGLLVSDYLNGNQAPGNYISAISRNGLDYNGYNFLAGNANELFYYSNMGEHVKKITPGIYGLSNHLLDTPWPKVMKGKEGLTAITSRDQFKINDIFDLLADDVCPGDDILPDTGIGIEWERILGPLFIRNDIYGTRCSTVITIDYDSNIEVVERSFVEQGVLPENSEKQYKILVKSLANY